MKYFCSVLATESLVEIIISKFLQLFTVGGAIATAIFDLSSQRMRNAKKKERKRKKEKKKKKKKKKKRKRKKQAKLETNKPKLITTF